MAKGAGGRGPSQPKFGWEFFGSELKRRREAVGFTQQELGERVFCSGSYICQFESAARKPQLDLAQRIDAELETDGFFGRMCEELINQSPYEDYFADVVELQTLAATIREYAPLHVPGLLQTEGYARAVFRAAAPFRPAEETEKLVRGRMERGNLLHKEPAPQLWTILDENILRRPIGENAVIAEQLEHIVTTAREGRALVQVLPYSSREYGLLEGSLTLMTFEEAPSVAYSEGPCSGQLLDDPAVVARCQAAYDLARAAALPPKSSLALIQSAAEQYRDES